MSPTPDSPATPDAAGGEGVMLEVVDGQVRIVPAPGAASTADLSWTTGAVQVWLGNERVEGTNCTVTADSRLRVEAVVDEARTRYNVMTSRDRMEATLRVVPEPGRERRLVDAVAASRLRLQVEEEEVAAPAPDFTDAIAEVQGAGVVHGVDEDGIRAAIEAIGTEHVIATGTDSVEGRSGYLEHLIDFEQFRRTGVLADTPLLRRVRSKPGTPGRDVTGRELVVAPVKDVKIRPGAGVITDEQGVMAIASMAGSPHVDSEGHVEVRHELVLEVVDTLSGDISFNGSIRVQGDVGEGRRVVARDGLVVEGNVDRAYLESGGSMQVDGSIMSSVLRAGGERAVAATISDRILGLPRDLGVAAAQARQFRDQGEARGTEVSHGLSIQLVLERVHRGVLPAIASVLGDLRDAGPSHQASAERVANWYRALSTAANASLTPEQFQELLAEVTGFAADIQRACEQPADLIVNYMQTSEAEATGTVTLVGKGIFSSRIVAWGGMAAKHYDAVFRGGSIVSHGKVNVREVGSPAGAKTIVQLVKGASLEADRAYAGTVITGPGYTHRFVGDRVSVHITFDTAGAMNVESLAA